MNKPFVLLIGQHSDEQYRRMAEQFETLSLAGPCQIATLSEAHRSRVAAIAYQGHMPFGSAEMDLLPGLRLVANFGVGYDSIDVVAATKRRILVTNTPDVLNDDVADLAVGMYLALKRRITDADAWVRSGGWASHGDFQLNQTASGARIGILGLGRVGLEIANRLVAFKAEVHYQSRSRKNTPDDWVYHEDAESLASAVDVLFVTIVGGNDTQGIVSEEVLEALAADGLVINVSRGSVIDEAALIRRLESGCLAGAGLDVFHNEPDVDPRLSALSNVLLQPHHGSATHQTRAAMADLQFRNVQAYFQGRALPNAVNAV